jgi:hypothetical protein
VKVVPVVPGMPFESHLPDATVPVYPPKRRGVLATTDSPILIKSSCFGAVRDVAQVPTAVPYLCTFQFDGTLKSYAATDV